jgi:hypothetical protein
MGVVGSFFFLSNLITCAARRRASSGAAAARSNRARGEAPRNPPAWAARTPCLPRVRLRAIACPYVCSAAWLGTRGAPWVEPGAA